MRQLSCWCWQQELEGGWGGAPHTPSATRCNPLIIVAAWGSRQERPRAHRGRHRKRRRRMRLLSSIQLSSDLTKHTRPLAPTVVSSSKFDQRERERENHCCQLRLLYTFSYSARLSRVDGCSANSLIYHVLRHYVIAIVVVVFALVSRKPRENKKQESSGKSWNGFSSEKRKVSCMTPKWNQYEVSRDARRRWPESRVRHVPEVITRKDTDAF